jgi:hypothetical protein
MHRPAQETTKATKATIKTRGEAARAMGAIETSNAKLCSETGRRRRRRSEEVRAMSSLRQSRDPLDIGEFAPSLSSCEIGPDTEDSRTQAKPGGFGGSPK